jgi:hypothetical protein
MNMRALKLPVRAIELIQLLQKFLKESFQFHQQYGNFECRTCSCTHNPWICMLTVLGLCYCKPSILRFFLPPALGYVVHLKFMEAGDFEVT